MGRLLLYTYLHPPIRGFFLQSFCFHIGGEHPKRDVALNGNQSLGLIQENKSFYSWMTVSQPGIEIVANCSFLDELFFKNQESYDRIFCLFYFYFCNSVKFCTKKMLPTIGSCWKFVGTHGNSSLLFMMKVIGQAFCLQLSYAHYNCTVCCAILISI